MNTTKKRNSRRITTEALNDMDDMVSKGVPVVYASEVASRKHHVIGRGVVLAAWKRRDRETPERKRKRRARYETMKAIKNGTIKVEHKCAMEDENCYWRLEIHHNDYDNPLDVVCLCSYHHKIIHGGLSG